MQKQCFGLSSGTLTLANTANTCVGRTTEEYITTGYRLAVTKLANGGSNSSIGTSSDNIGVNGGALKYIGSTGAQTTNLGFKMASGGTNVDASGVTSSDTISFSGTPTYSAANAARAITLTGANVGSNTMAFIFGNNGTGINTLTKSGIGKWVLSQANTYTGATTVNGGNMAHSDKPPSPVPVFLDANPEHPDLHLEQDPAFPAVWRARMFDPVLKKEVEVRLEPFHRVYHQRYAVYWKVVTPAQASALFGSRLERAAP